MPAPSSSAAPDRGSSAPLLELRRKLVWLTVFRTVATSLLLLATGVRSLTAHGTDGLSREDSLSYLLIGVVYATTLIYGLVLRRRKVGQGAAYAQILGDVLLASCLVYLTGGIDSPFTFTYSIAVVAASILLWQRGALIAAAASSAAFAALTFAIWSGALQPPSGSPPISLNRVVFLLASNVLAQFLIAALASYVARQLSAAGGQLEAREADLKELVQLQNHIVHAMPSGLITCEEDGRVTFINPAASAILGLPAGHRVGRNIEELLPEVLRLGPRARRAELSVDTPAGRRILGLTVSPLEGSPGAQLIVFQDLTDLRRAEDELRRADQLASLGKLSAQLAHEIRNPLASMRGSAQMLAAESHHDLHSAKLANILIRESDRLAALVEDFLRFARPPPPSRADVSLSQLAKDTVEMLRADPLAMGVQLELQVEEVFAQVDPAQVRQVLINLIRNGLAAVGPGGTVRVGLAERDGWARLSVWDSAGSIASKDLERIFDPFFTTREAGTGLGLSTSHSIITAHGGKILVSSDPSRGTEFVVELPVRSEPHHARIGRR